MVKETLMARVNGIRNYRQSVQAEKTKNRKKVTAEVYAFFKKEFRVPGYKLAQEKYSSHYIGYIYQTKTSDIWSYIDVVDTGAPLPYIILRMHWHKDSAKVISSPTIDSFRGALAEWIVDNLNR